MDGTLNVKLLGVVLRWGLGAVFSGINIRCRDLGNVVPMPRDLGIAIVIPRSRDCSAEAEISGLHSRSRDPVTKVPMPRFRDCSADAEIREYCPGAEIMSRSRNLGTIVPVPKSRGCYPGPIITEMQIGPAFTGMQYRSRNHGNTIPVPSPL